MSQEKISDKKQELIVSSISKDYKKLHEIDWIKKVKLSPFEKRITNNPYYYFQWAYERLCPGKVLDAGCGDGEFAARYQDKEIDVMDFADNALSMAMKNNANRSIPIKHFYKSFQKIPHEEYDNVICLEVLEHIPKDNQKQFMKNLFDSCKLGGKILISVPIKGKLNDPMHFGEREFYDWIDLISEFIDDFKFYFISKFGIQHAELNIHAFECFKH